MAVSILEPVVKPGYRTLSSGVMKPIMKNGMKYLNVSLKVSEVMITMNDMLSGSITVLWTGRAGVFALIVI